MSPHTAATAHPAPAPAAHPARPAAVEAVGVTRRYGSGEAAVDALRGVDLRVASGDFTAVMGPSGSGKSTLMHICAGLDSPTGGVVRIGGEEITAMGDRQLTRLRRTHIGFVFQAFNLLPVLTAEENVLLPMRIAGRTPDDEWVRAVMDRVGLTERAGHRPSELSGGQQQRVALARAIVSEPTVLFADEPTGNLDSKTGADVLALLREAVDTYGQSTVMVPHDARAAAVADRVVFLADGRVAGTLDDPTEAAVLAAMKELNR
jgi:putative ABC transport system ATP-binding protein